MTNLLVTNPAHKNSNFVLFVYNNNCLMEHTSHALHRAVCDYLVIDTLDPMIACGCFCAYIW